MSSKLPSGFKSREEYNKYMKNYLQMYRSHQKAKYERQDEHEQAIEKRFITAQIDLNMIVFASLYLTDKKIRDIDNLDEVDKIYKDLWKELETHEAKLKEL